MTTRYILTFVFVTLFITLNAADSVYAQDLDPIRVYLDVSGDKQIENEVRSYLSRELRALKNIILVVNDYNIGIRVIAHRNKAVDGEYLGTYTMSVVVTSRLQEDTVRKLLYLMPIPESAETARDILLNLIKNYLDSVELHVLLIKGDIQEMCKELIANIDGRIFEANRLANQRIQEIFSKPRKETPEKPPTTPIRSGVTKKP